MNPTCKQEDHDGFGLVCGYPLPCPWHTAIIDVSADPARVVIPVTSSTGLKQRERLVQIARAVSHRYRSNTWSSARTSGRSDQSSVPSVPWHTRGGYVDYEDYAEEHWPEHGLSRILETSCTCDTRSPDDPECPVDGASKAARDELEDEE